MTTQHPTRPAAIRAGTKPCRGNPAQGAGCRRIVAASAAALTLALAACGGGGDAGPGAGQPAGALGGPGRAGALQATQTTMARLPLLALSAEEAAGLQLMREEEKMARDVYTALYGVWGSWVFDNIADAEQTHMDAVAALLNRHQLADPAEGLAPGHFADGGLQALHDALVAAGRTSLVEALKVGAEIEDVDIRDLRALKAATDKADLLLVYDNLERGSRNHLRSFHTALKSMSATYTPKYLTQAAYDAVVNSPMERGNR